jgi:hypothetical protein
MIATQTMRETVGMESIVDYVVYVIPEAASSLSEISNFLAAFASLVSVLIACLALRFSSKQIKIHEQHNRLMATPHLSGWNHINSDTDTYTFTLENNGLGPAIVREITLLVDGNPQEGKGSELIKAAVDKMFAHETINSGIEMFTTGEFIAVGKKFDILTIKITNKKAEDLRMYVAGKTQLLISYDSILGDSYLFDSELD